VKPSRSNRANNRDELGNNKREPSIYLINMFDSLKEFIPFILLLVCTANLLKHSNNRRTKIVSLIPITLVIILFVSFHTWRGGNVVARAQFNPGIAPFDIEVREVPIPVTNSNHFIVTLSRGQYPVTSFRYFWTNYTPTNIKIDWKKLDSFTVTFDDKYVASCNWSWGNHADWTMVAPANAQVAGEIP
jgi:hypothetical protein